MEFLTVIKSIFTMLAFMAMGFAMVKLHAASEEHAKTLSAFLIYCATPGMFIASFQEMQFDASFNRNLLLFFILSLAVQLLMFAILLLVFGRKMQEGRYRILTIGSFMGNVGFFGQPLILSLFPDHPEASCYCMMFALSMNILVFTIGEFMISRDRKYISLKKAVLNPAVLAAAVALPLYFMKIRLSGPVFSIMYTLRSMTAPVCMLILGLRLASMKFRDVFGEPFAYFVSALKLMAFPLLTFALLMIFPSTDRVFRLTMIISAGTPCASVILALAEVHDCESRRAAYSVLVSSVLCALTLPLLTLLMTSVPGGV